MAGSRSLGVLTVDVVAKIGGFERGMGQAERASKQRLDAIARHAKRAGAMIGTALAAGATAAAVAIKQAIDNADALDEMAQRTGIAVETLSRLQLAAKFGAVEMEDLQKAVGRLAVEQQKVAEGNEDSVALFRAMGVEAVDASGKLRNAEDVLVDLADVFASMPDGAQKTALAMELLGKAGQNMIPFFNQGGAKIAELNRRADELGITLTKETTAAASDFNDELSLLGLAVEGLATQVAVELLPDLKDIVSEFANVTTKGDGVTTTAKEIAEAVRQITSTTVGALALLNSYSNVMQSVWSLAGQGMSALAGNDQGAEGFAALARQNWAEAQSSWARANGLPDPNAPQGFTREESRRPTGKAGVSDALAELLAQRKADAEAAKGQAAADKAAAEAARELERADAELQRRLEEMAQQHDAYVLSLDQLEAQLSGPLAVAEQEHAAKIAETQRLLDESTITVDEATRAQMLYAEAFEKTRDELDPYGESLRLLLDDMQFELDLLGQTNAARITSIELRRLGIDLSTQEGQAAAAAIEAQAEQLEAMHEQINAMDDFRSSFEDNVAGVLDGSKSIKDALRDMVDDFIAQLARMAAQNFSESLFGQMGSSQTGSAGGWISSLFAAFGGARAGGGDVAGGKAYLVGEQGPEMFIPSASGSIATAGQTRAMMSRSGRPAVINIHGPTGRQTITQMRIELERQQNKATGAYA